METIYQTTVTSTGDGRNGHVRSDDGLLDMDVARPPAMGGAGDATNPEQLFAAGYAACFHSAIKAMGRQHDIPTDGTAVTAEASLLKGEGGFGIGVTLRLRADHLDDATAQRLIELAHQICPYSVATRGNVDVSLHIDRA
ncbi:MAG: organic hydroperoxide resistance protein [Thermomicrobiales bacterium]